MWLAWPSLWPAGSLYLEEKTLYAWQGKKAGLQPIADPAAFLRAGRRRNYRLVINQRREQIVFETLPAQPRGVAAQFFAARLRRLFPDMPWHSVMPKTRRAAATDLTWLALSETPALRQVLAAFAESGAGLTGLYSVVQLLPLDFHDAPHLLISEHCQHVRCSLIAGGCLRASQLIAATADGTHEIRQFLAREQQGNLPVILLGSPSWRDALPLPDGLLPLSPTPASLRAFFAGIRHWPRMQFALPAQLATARRRNRSLALGVLGACGLLVAAGFGYGGPPDGETRFEARPAQPLGLPELPEAAPTPLADLPPVAEPAEPTPRLEGRVSRAGRVVNEWREGGIALPADPALAVGDSRQQPLLPAGSLQIHRGSGR